MSEHPADPAGRREANGEPEPRVVFRDKRRLDPVTGEIRTPDASPASDASGAAQASTGSAAPPVTEDKAAELQADLKRVAAEYSNYRRRVERDRIAVGEQATGTVLVGLLPVLDDIERAREHGDLTGAFAAVADSLQTALTKLGLTAFGEVGDEFDPTRHEAVMHQRSGEVTRPTCVLVMRRGYQIGERLLRPAMVGVAEPEAPTAAASADHIAPSNSEGADIGGDAPGTVDGEQD